MKTRTLGKIFSALLIAAILVMVVGPAVSPATSVVRAQAPGTCPGGYPNGTSGSWNGAPQVCCNGVWQWGNSCPLSVTPPNGWNPGIGGSGTINNGQTVKSLILIDSAAFNVTGPAGNQVLVRLKQFKSLPNGMELAFGGTVAATTAESLLGSSVVSDATLLALGPQVLGVVALGGTFYFTIEARYGRGTVKRLWDMYYMACQLAGTYMFQQVDRSSSQSIQAPAGYPFPDHLVGKADSNNRMTAWSMLLGQWLGGRPPDKCYEFRTPDNRSTGRQAFYSLAGFNSASSGKWYSGLVVIFNGLTGSSTAYYNVSSSNPVSTAAGEMLVVVPCGPRPPLMPAF